MMKSGNTKVEGTLSMKENQNILQKSLQIMRRIQLLQYKL